MELSDLHEALQNCKHEKEAADVAARAVFLELKEKGGYEIRARNAEAAKSLAERDITHIVLKDPEGDIEIDRKDVEFAEMTAGEKQYLNDAYNAAIERIVEARKEKLEESKTTKEKHPRKTPIQVPPKFNVVKSSDYTKPVVPREDKHTIAEEEWKNLEAEKNKDERKELAQVEQKATERKLRDVERRAEGAPPFVPDP